MPWKSEGVGLALAGDIGDADFCRRAVDCRRRDLASCAILVNHAGEQHPDYDIRDILTSNETDFQTNVFGMFYLTQAAVDHIPPRCHYQLHQRNNV